MNKTYEIKIHQTEEQKKDPVCNAIVGELIRQLEHLNSIPKIQEELFDRVNKLIEGLKKYDITVTSEPIKKTETKEIVSQIEVEPTT